MTNLRRVSYMRRDESLSSVAITPLAHTYFGDVLDHCITLIQALEQMDASAANISSLIFNTVGARTNNFMMILAFVTIFYAPLTAVSGYFGMNFSSGAGLAHGFSYYFLVAIPITIASLGGVYLFVSWDMMMGWARKKWRTRQRRQMRRRFMMRPLRR